MLPTATVVLPLGLPVMWISAVDPSQGMRTCAFRASLILTRRGFSPSNAAFTARASAASAAFSQASRRRRLSIASTTSATLTGAARETVT